MGGKRPGSGRPRGRKNKATIAAEASFKNAALGLAEDFTSLMLFQAVYRDDQYEIDVRLAAAGKALPYEHPTLAAIQHTGKDGKPIEVNLVNYAAAQLAAPATTATGT